MRGRARSTRTRRCPCLRSATPPDMPVDANPRRRAGSYRWLLKYAGPYRAGWTTIVSATLFSTVLSLVQPWPLKVLVDHILGDLPLTGILRSVMAALPGTSVATGRLAWVVVAGIVIFAVNSAVDATLSLQWTRVGRRMVYRLSQDLFARIQRRS